MAASRGGQPAGGRDTGDAQPTPAAIDARPAPATDRRETIAGGRHGARRLREFVAAMGALLEQGPGEPRLLEQGAALLRRLLSRDDWLPEALARPDPHGYRQYLLHADPAGRFSVVSFVWGPGQATPIHDHTVWGLVGVLRGAERSQRYRRDAAGRWLPHGAPALLGPGDVEAVSPSVGDVHRVCNPLADRASVSIHVYGADIGTVRRSVYTEDGGRRPFVSGYSDAAPPDRVDGP